MAQYVFTMNRVGKIVPPKRQILKDISLSFFPGAKIGVLGLNGSGKSTLLKIMAGLDTEIEGEATPMPGLSIGYLPQEPKLNPEHTVRESVEESMGEVFAAKAKLEEVYTAYGEPDADFDALAAEQARLEAIIATSGTDSEHQLEIAADALRLPPWEAKIKNLSGGEKRRVALCRLLLQKPDLLLLDEPTNHLDLDALVWLEAWLQHYSGTMIVISHDKAFVDNLTNRTIEITRGRIYDYKTNYTHYLQLRQERREQQQKQFDDQAKQIADIQEFIDRFKGTYSKTLQVQSRVKMLEKIEIVEVDEVDTSALNLKFPPAPRSGNYPVIVTELTKKYGDHTVFKNASLTIARGDKVAFVGKNGEGKSTLIKAIMGEIEYEGKLQLGHNCMVGYFAQNQASLLDEALTVFETIDQIAQGDVRTKIKDLLGAFMFGGDAIDKKVKVLSGGERTRLAMLRLLLQPVNLLILDEPTNHLDIKTKDILKDALKAFDGTLILVSHDRDFLDGLATKVYEFGQQRVREHFEDINGFLRNKKMENLRDIERKKEVVMAKEERPR